MLKLQYLKGGEYLFLATIAANNKLPLELELSPETVKHYSRFIKGILVDSHNKIIHSGNDVQNDPKSYCMASTALSLKEVKSHTILPYLKVIKLEGFANQENETSLAEHIRDLVTVEWSH